MEFSIIHHFRQNSHNNHFQATNITNIHMGATSRVLFQSIQKPTILMYVREALGYAHFKSTFKSSQINFKKYHPGPYVHHTIKSQQLHKQAQIQTFLIRSHLIVSSLIPIIFNIPKHNKNYILIVILII